MNVKVIEAITYIHTYIQYTCETEIVAWPSLRSVFVKTNYDLFHFYLQILILHYTMHRQTNVQSYITDNVYSDFVSLYQATKINIQVSFKDTHTIICSFMYFMHLQFRIYIYDIFVRT